MLDPWTDRQTDSLAASECASKRCVCVCVPHLFMVFVIRNARVLTMVRIDEMLGALRLCLCTV